MKRMLSAFLSFALMLSLTACGGTQPSIDSSQVVSTALDDELERAVSYGLVSAEELTNLDAAVTYSQFCGLLTRVITMQGEELVPAWEELAAAALASDEPMQRDDALLAMFEASIIIGDRSG